MHKIRILTVSESAPLAVLDKVLTAAEEALELAGARRVWIERDSSALAVMAELPVGPERTRETPAVTAVLHA
jgi:hypothetical protein